MKWSDRALIYSPLYYCLCVTEAEFRSTMNRLKVPAEQWGRWVRHGADATTHFLTYRDEDRPVECAVVCLSGYEKYSGVLVAAMLVHEAVHIWQRVKELIGEDTPSIEFEAYSIQAISQDLMHAYVDRVSRRTKP